MQAALALLIVAARDRREDAGLLSRRIAEYEARCSRIAMEALGYAPDLLVPDARWLIDNLVDVATPEPGDIVGYSRAAFGDTVAGGYDRLWHVMIYAGNGMVIGACDLKRAVVTRPVDYKPVLGPHRWRFVGDPPAPFRRLEVR